MAEDAFDEMMDNDEKMIQVCDLLTEFVNGQLIGLGIRVKDLVDEFSDGVLLIILIGCIVNPLPRFHLTFSKG